MNLSNRLKYLADEIKSGETMADIGCDHGFLPIYLLKKGISPKAIMCDVSEGSLAKAVENCRHFIPSMDFDGRLGDGLKIIEKAEVDDIVIAGMGGILISEILAADIEKTLSFKKLILQPRTHIEILRDWLINNGFYIIKEGLVMEIDRICEIITAVPLRKHHRMYPIDLIYQKSILTTEYIDREISKYEHILNSIESKSKLGEKHKHFEETLLWLKELRILDEESNNEKK